LAATDKMGSPANLDVNGAYLLKTSFHAIHDDNCYLAVAGDASE
jgi:hypothetical protein